MAKKSFTSDLSINPASMFIGSDSLEKKAGQTEQKTQAEHREPETKDIPAGYVLTKEPKSRRLQLLIQPSLYKRIKAQAEQEKVSVNELINSLLDEVAKR